MRWLLALFAMLLALSVTPALAAPPIATFTGSTPTLTFGAPSPAGIPYVYTNQGTGMAARRIPLVWSYDERGTVVFLPPPAPPQQVVASATYKIALARRPNRSITLHVIPSSYKVTFSEPSNPCSHGTFSQRTREGVFISGTFDCLNGVPSGQMDFVIELPAWLERLLDG